VLKINQRKTNVLVSYHNLGKFRHCTTLKITKHIAKEKKIEIITIRPKNNKIVTITNDKNIVMERVYTYLWLRSNLTTISIFYDSLQGALTIGSNIYNILDVFLKKNM